MENRKENKKGFGICRLELYLKQNTMNILNSQNTFFLVFVKNIACPLSFCCPKKPGAVSGGSQEPLPRCPWPALPWSPVSQAGCAPRSVGRSRQLRQRNFSFQSHSGLALRSRESKMPAGSAWCQPALLLLLSCVPLWAAGISCRNEDGETVDWFSLYKLPKHAKGQIPLLGLEYLYMDALTPQWQLGKHLINMSQGALGQTLQQLYETYESKRNTTAYAIYNDEIPESDSKGSKCGHTKGFLLLDKSQGFWVIHSVPLFPPSPEDGYGYPSTGESFGQTAICITFKYDQFTEIDQQMLSYNPGIYSCSIPDIFQADLPNLQKLCAKSRLPSPPLHRLSKLQSAQGETFLHFAKSHLFIDDIYVAWMAQELKTDLLAESWQRSGEKLYSNCSLDYHVYNINIIGMPLNSTFHSINDHSKWAVSRKYKDQWTCIGDLNRAAEQAWRSGGFICTQNEQIYKAFRHLIIHYESCTSAPRDL